MPKNKSYFKSQNGVTLLALVIIVVVTIILVRVGIETAYGDHGVIDGIRKEKSDIIEKQDRLEDRINMLENGIEN